MHYDEALALLAVTPAATPDQIRRAYLRRVRVVRPERDPEGFKQLRAAYELLKDAPRPLATQGAVDDDGSAPEPPADAEVDSPGPSGDDPPLERDEPRDEASEAAPGVEWAPDDADPLVRDEWPDAHIFEARRALERGDEQAAVASLERAVAVAEATLRFGDPIALPRLWLTLADSDVSTTVAPFVGRWADAVSRSGVLLGQTPAVLLVLVAELAGLWPDMPAEVGRAIAAGLFEADFEEAMPALYDFAWQQPADGRAVSNMMRERAPHLYQIYGELLRAQDPAQGNAPNRAQGSAGSAGGGLPWWVYWIGLMLLFRVVSQCDDDDRRASVDDDRWRIEHAREAEREAAGQTGQQGAALGDGYEITDGGRVRVTRPGDVGGAEIRPTDSGATGDAGDDR